MAERLVAQHLFSNALEDANKRFQEGLSLIESKAGAVVGDGSNRNGVASKAISCCEYGYYCMVDLIYSTSEEEKKLREFKRHTLPKLSQGMYFELVEAGNTDGSLVSKLSNSVLSSIMGSASSNTGATPSMQQDIVVVTLAADDLNLCWKTMELERNRPKASGTIPLSKVANVSESDGHVEITNSKNERILVLKSSERGEASAWVAMLLEALAVLREDIEDQNTQSRGALYRQQRLLEMEKRKRQREAQKKELDRKLGAKGYIRK